MAPWRTLSIALQASTAGYVRGLTGAAAATKSFGNQAERGFKQADKAAKNSGATADRTASRWRSFGQTAALGIAAVGIALGFSLKEAIAWESAFAGVVKTVDGTEAELGDLEDRLLGMARRLPASRGEIAAVAEAAGQLGVALPDVARFTEVMIALGVSTNLSADDAATGLARMMNIMGTASGDVERLGATLVDLGNKGASTEDEILRMATRMAGGGRLLGLTEANVLSLANALSSIGVHAELGSGVMTRFFTKLYSAAQKGNLDDWAAGARMSVEEFARVVANDPIKAIDAFVGGMARTREEGGNVIQILEDVGLKGTLNMQVLTSLAGGHDVLAQSIKDGNQAWQEGTALADEAAKRYATAESQIRVFGNKVTDVGRQVGAALIPLFLGALDAAERFGAWMGRVGLDTARRLESAWEDLEGAGRNLARILGVVWDTGEPLAVLFAKLGGAAVIAGLTGLAASLEAITGFLAENEGAVKGLTIAMVAYLGTQAPAALSAILWGLGNMLAVLGKIRAAVAATAIVQGLQGIATGFAMMSTSVTAGATQVRAGLATMTSGIGVMSLAFGAAAAAATVFFMGLQQGHAKARRQLDELKPPEYDDRSIQSLIDHQQALTDAAGAYENGSKEAASFLGAIKGSAQMLTPFENSVLDSAIATGDFAKAADVADAATKSLIASYKAAGDELNMGAGKVEQWVMKLNIPRETIDNHEQLVRLIGEAANAAENGTPQTDKLATSYNVLADATSSSTDRLKAWQDQVDAILGTEKGIFDATTSWNDALMSFTETTTKSIDGREVTEPVLDLTAGLDGLTEAAQKNRGAVSGAVDAAIDLAVAYGERDGIEAANYALELNRQRLTDVMIQAGLTKAEAAEYLEVLGLTPENIQTIIATNADEATAKAQALTAEMAAIPTSKTITITWREQRLIDWERYGQSYGGGSWRAGRENRWGAVHSYAKGGIHAMIGKGDLIRWAEPETGGEAYIPRLGDRGRSVSILGEAASWYGFGLHPKNGAGALSFAAGGITGIQPPGFIAPPPQVTVMAPAGGGSTNYYGGITQNIHVDKRTPYKPTENVRAAWV